MKEFNLSNQRIMWGGEEHYPEKDVKEFIKIITGNMISGYVSVEDIFKCAGEELIKEKEGK